MREIRLAITAELCAHLGLTASSTDGEFGAAISMAVNKAKKADEFQAEKEKAEKALSDYKKGEATKEVTAMLKTALEGKKISVAVHDQLAIDYAEKPEPLKKVLEGMSAYTPVTDKITDGQKKLMARYEGKKWRELYEAGVTEQLGKDFPELYKELYKEEYGNEPAMMPKP